MFYKEDKNKIASIGSPILQEIYMNLLFICDFNLEEFEKFLDDNDKNILNFKNQKTPSEVDKVKLL